MELQERMAAETEEMERQEVLRQQARVEAAGGVVVADDGVGIERDLDEDIPDADGEGDLDDGFGEVEEEDEMGMAVDLDGDVPSAEEEEDEDE